MGNCRRSSRRFNAHLLRFEQLEPRQLLAAGPLITELMASNGITLFDLDGDSPDWFEVHNPSDAPVSLLGYSVTDDPDVLDKWQFSGVTLEPDDYLVVFASGKDRSGENIRVRVTRDYVATPDGTFLVDLPVGTYTVRLTAGDSERIRDDVAISLQGNVVDTITTQPGEIVVKSYAAEVDAASGGQLAVRLEDTGGQSGRGIINGLVVTPSGDGESWRFDFGREGSPVELGYRSVTSADTYSPAVGYGWAAGVTLSEQDGGQTDGEQHTNYKLSTGGEYLALISAEGEVLSEYGPDGSEYPEQFTDISYGITGTDPGSDAFYFQRPTPGAANNADSIALGFVEDTTFTVDRGFYDEPFDVEIATTTPGATIVHTTDGSEPTLQNGIAVPAPDGQTPPRATIHIERTTVLRAAAFKENYAPTNVDAHTYLFVDDVIQQDFQATLDAGFPEQWSDEPADYGLAPEVIGQNGEDLFDGRFAATIRDDLQAIPTMSLVLDIDDMFGPQGIYSNSEERGRAWERPVSIEFFDPQSDDEFQLGAGIRILGDLSRRPPWKKHGFRLFFKSAYGPAELEYPVFGQGVADRFNTLMLRPNIMDGWIWDDSHANGTYLRNEFVLRTQRAMGHPSTHGRYVHLYINGFYWGLYDAIERPDALFAETYFGVDADEWDIIKHPGGELGRKETVAGSQDAWNTLIDLVEEVPVGANEVDKTALFQRVQGKNPDGMNNPEFETYLDLENYIDYMILNQFVGNIDWGDFNFYMARSRGAQSTGFKFFTWDAERTMGAFGSDLKKNTVTIGGGVAAPHEGLRSGEEYRLKFADRVQKHFFHGGQLTLEANIARLQHVAQEIDRAIVAESARWGGFQHRRTPPPHNRDDWLRSTEWIRDTYFPQRPDIVLQQLRDFSLYPLIAAPEMSIDGQPQHGGIIAAGSDLTLDEAGQSDVTIYYVLDGEDPREMGGAISPAAITFQPDVDPPITLNQTTLVKARIRDGSGDWSALSESLFDVVPLGDMNLDGTPNTIDIGALVLGLKSPTEYESIYGVPPSLPGDLDRDGDLDFDDIDEFVALVTSGVESAVNGQQRSDRTTRQAAAGFVFGLSDTQVAVHGAHQSSHGDVDAHEDVNLDDVEELAAMSEPQRTRRLRVTRSSRISSLDPHDFDVTQGVWSDRVDTLWTLTERIPKDQP